LNVGKYDAETMMSIYSYYRYGTIAMIHSKYIARKPLPVVLLSNNLFCWCISMANCLHWWGICAKKAIGIVYYSQCITEVIDSYYERYIKSCCLSLLDHVYSSNWV